MANTAEQLQALYIGKSAEVERLRAENEKLRKVAENAFGLLDAVKKLPASGGWVIGLLPLIERLEKRLKEAGYE